MKYYTIIQFCSLLTLVHSELADPDWMLLQELHYKGWPESRRELGCWRQVKYKLEDNANSFDNLGLCAQMFEHTQSYKPLAGAPPILVIDPDLSPVK